MHPTKFQEKGCSRLGALGIAAVRVLAAFWTPRPILQTCCMGEALRSGAGMVVRPPPNSVGALHTLHWWDLNTKTTNALHMGRSAVAVQRYTVQMWAQPTHAHAQP